ncbi:MAG: hypothetical protein AAF280_06065 [Pseudomonadota bacterium]
MRVRRDAWLNQTGIKVIRLVIGSHFCAMALGVPVGFDPFFLVTAALPGELGQMIGAAALFTLAIAFICGVMLRVVSLTLAGFLIFSAMATLLLSGDAAVGPLWQSIALGAAVLLCYGALRPHELHKTALFPVRTLRGAVAREIKQGVSPRRVVPKARTTKAERPDPFGRTFTPLIAPTERMIGLAQQEAASQKRRAVRKAPLEDLAEDEVQNIFVNI